MASTLTQLQYHAIWSTKHREPMISAGIEENVWRILAATALRHSMKIQQVGGIENHVHVLIDIPKTLSVSEAMKQLKGGSSKAINDEKLFDGAHFGWQDGYAAFTVSASQAPSVVHYIANQRKHHRVQTFEDEFVAFLEKHEVDFDPAYLWD